MSKYRAGVLFGKELVASNSSVWEEFSDAIGNIMNK
jgi:hypothetical protein